MISFSNAGDIAKSISGFSIGEQGNNVEHCKSIDVGKSAYNSWRRVKHGRNVSDHVDIAALCGCMFGLNRNGPFYDVAPTCPISKCIEDEETFMRLQGWLVGPGSFKSGSREVLSILEEGYRPDSGAVGRLCEAVVCESIGRSHQTPDLVDARSSKEVAANKDVSYMMRSFESPSWLATSNGADHERLVVGEMNRYAHSLVQQSRSVLTEFQIETTIDVSKWPKSPYRVRQTVCQTRAGDNSHIFHEAVTFQDLQKASSFRYTKLVIRNADPARQSILNISGLPHYSDFQKSDGLRFPKPEGFDVRCDILEDSLNDPEGRRINVLHYEIKGEDLTIVLENWEPHHSYYARNSVLQSGVRDRRRKHDAFYAASLDIIAPKGREYSIELSSEYDAWSIGENRFFREMVYQPSIKAEIVGADSNAEYDFTLHQYSSQSPFWRRQDGKHYVEDLSLGVNTPQRLWWRYSNQWLLLGEGYAIVVDAQRR